MCYCRSPKIGKTEGLPVNPSVYHSEVFFFLLLQHAPLHYVILHAGFARIQVYMIGSCAGFLFLVV